MKKQLYIIINLILSAFYLNSCGVEPEKDPALMELMVGKYHSGFEVVKGLEIIGYLDTEGSTHQLTINSDYTFTLFIKGTHPKVLDSTIIIDQKGTFEIPYSRFDPKTNCQSYFCEDPSYVGDIMFYVENEKLWGGRFECSINNYGWGFISPRKIVSEDGVEITFTHWEKVDK